MADIPDTVGLLMIWAQSVTGLASTEVSVEVPDPIPADFLQIRRIGGPGLPPARDQPLIQFSSWAPTDRLATLRLDEIRAALNALQEDSTPLGVTVYAVDEQAGPTSTTDPQTGRRYAFMRQAITVRADAITRQFS